MLGNDSAVYGDEDGEAVSSSLTFNALQFNLEGRSNDGDDFFSIDNLKINGASVSGGPFGSFGSFEDFGVTGFGSIADFIITGDLTRNSLGASQQSRPRLDLIMGNVAPVPAPAAALLLVTGFAGMFGARRFLKG